VAVTFHLLEQLRSATGPVQERRLDLRLHSRSHGGRASAQVADVSGRIYSRVLGVARVGFLDGGRGAEDLGPGDRATWGTDTHQE